MTSALGGRTPLGFRPAALRDMPWAQRTIPGLLERQAAAHGDRALVSAPGGERTVAGLRDAVAGRAATLREAGVAPGDRVALMASNRIELLELMLACPWAGAVAVPLNTALRGEGLRHVLTNSGARLLVTEPELAGWVRAAGELPDLERVWLLGEDVPPPGAPAAAHPARFSDVATMLYTSGTTGPAKGVLGPHAQIVNFALDVCELLEIEEDDVLYTCLPLFHVNAWNAVFQALVSGARVVLAPRFSASRFWAEVVEAQATVTYLLGAMIPILLRRPPGELDRAHRLRVVNGNAPPADVAAAARERFGIWVAENYASTETGCVLGAPLDEQRPGWMGRAMEGFEVRVADEEDEEVPDGTPGELFVRPTRPCGLFRGYHGMPERTVAAWRNLWFHTGDQVVRDPEDARLRFLGRTADAIRRRGENVSALEVEQALGGHPDVADVAVFGVPSELGEDEVMAAVVPREGAAPDPLELVRWCEGRLAYFAIPRFVEVVAALPLTENGKVRKVALRERGVTDAAFDLERSGHRVARPAR